MKKKLLLVFFLLIVISGSLYIGIKFIYKKSIPASVPASIQKVELKQKQDKLQEYNKYLNALPLNKPESIIDAKNRYFELFSLNDSQELRDSAFLDYYNFYNNVISKLNEELLENGIDFNQQSTKEKYYKKYGISLGGEEGMFFPEINFEFLVNNFGKFLSLSWNEYLKFSLKEYNQHPFTDGAVIISWDELRKNIIYQENFIKKYPGFSENNKIQENIDRYLGAYFGHFPNSPISESGIYEPKDTSQLGSDVKQSYEKFIQENKDSKYYPEVLKTYNIFKEHNFIVGKYYYKDKFEN